MSEIRILDKVASVERCVQRAREDYFKDPNTFADDYTRQDAAVLNILRACESCIDIGNIIIKREGLGLPRSNGEIFELLAQAGWVPAELSRDLKRMVGYRNIVVHAYTDLQLPVTVSVIETRLDDLLAFTRAVLSGLSGRRGGS